MNVHDDIAATTVRPNARSARFGARAFLCLGVTLLAGSLAHAQLDPATGVVFSQGETDPNYQLNSDPEVNDRLGEALATGDFDGDGTLDLVIGVPHEDYSTLTDSGWVHVIYGTVGGLDAVVEDISQEVFVCGCGHTSPKNEGPSD